MCLNSIKLISFDVTNTLLKFRIPPGQQYAITSLQHGVKTDEKEVASYFKTNYKMMSKQYPNFGHASSLSWEGWWTEVVKSTLKHYVKDEDKLEKIAQSLIDEYISTKSWLLTEGSLDFLANMSKCDVKLGVISNTDPRLHKILDNMKLRSYFDFVLPSYEAGYLKPDRRIFDKALERSNINNIQPNQALHIGDNLNLDYIGAKSAGWHALLVNKNSLQGINSDHLFRTFKDLDEAVKSNSLKL